MAALQLHRRNPEKRWMERSGYGLAWLVGLATIACSAAPAAEDSQSERTTPHDAAQAILAAFENYSVVGGMSAGHGNKDVDDFILDLIRDPSLPDKVNDIAVECGNPLYQDTLDRYIAGEDVPLADVQHVWRDTPEVQCGFSTFYERLFPLVRRVNQRLAADQRLRVLACDVPVDWTAVEGPVDWDSDAAIADIIRREVLEKSRKVLMLFGVYHMMHGPGSPVDSAVVQYERQGFTDTTFVIADHIGFGNRTDLGADNGSLEAKMASWPVPSLITLEGTWLAELDSAYFNVEPAFSGQRGYPGVDGYLYVGPRDLLLSEPLSAQAVLDRDYVAELQRRADLLGKPPDGPGRPEAILQRERTSSAFLYEPP